MVLTFDRFLGTSRTRRSSCNKGPCCKEEEGTEKEKYASETFTTRKGKSGRSGVGSSERAFTARNVRAIAVPGACPGPGQTIMLAAVRRPDPNSILPPLLLLLTPLLLLRALSSVHHLPIPHHWLALEKPLQDLYKLVLLNKEQKLRSARASLSCCLHFIKELSLLQLWPFS